MPRMSTRIDCGGKQTGQTIRWSQSIAPRMESLKTVTIPDATTWILVLPTCRQDLLSWFDTSKRFVKTTQGVFTVLGEFQFMQKDNHANDIANDIHPNPSIDHGDRNPRNPNKPSRKPRNISRNSITLGYHRANLQLHKAVGIQTAMTNWCNCNIAKKLLFTPTNFPAHRQLHRRRGDVMSNLQLLKTLEVTEQSDMTNMTQ